MNDVIQVECYSGSRYAERPLAFTVSSYRHIVKVVEESWRTPSGLHFRVRTEDDENFELTYWEKSDSWQIEKAAADTCD